VSDKIEQLREIYLAMREQMRVLAALNREVEAETGLTNDAIEEARQKVSVAHIEVWKLMRGAVFEEWLNATDTPNMLCRFPPKDMPRREV
jgi:hypothetical protein